VGQKILEMPLFESMVNLETSSPRELLAGRSAVADEGLRKTKSEIEALQKREKKEGNTFEPEVVLSTCAALIAG